MKFIYWAAVLFMAMIPLNVVLMITAKLVHSEPLNREDAIAMGFAVFGVIAATTIYRATLRGRRKKLS